MLSLERLYTWSLVEVFVSKKSKGSEKFLVQKNHWSKENFCSEIIFGPEKFLAQKNFGSKRLKVKILALRNVWPPKNFSPKIILWPKNFGCENICVRNKKMVSNNFLPCSASLKLADLAVFA